MKALESGTDGARRAADDIPFAVVRQALIQAVWPVRWIAAFIASIAGIAAIGCSLADIAITEVDLISAAALAAIVVGAIWRAAGLLTAAQPGVLWRWFRGSSRIGDGLIVIGVWIGSAATAGVLSYLCARLRLPLYDRQFVAVDAALGFNWLAWSNAVSHYPVLRRTLWMAYNSLKFQLIATLMLTAFLPGNRRIQFLWAATASAMITCVISGLLPVLGARPQFGVAGAEWLGDLLLLRGPDQLDFPLTALHGIVSLPSYHTVLGVLFAWSVRRTGWLSVAVLALNVVMIVSTLNVGGHYLVDVIAGLLLAWATIATVTAAERRSHVANLQYRAAAAS